MKKLFVCTLVLFCSAIGFVYGESCVYCDPKVIARQSVFEGRYFTILLDHAPYVPGHLLLVPKRHLLRADELSSEEWQELSVMTPKIAAVFKRNLATDKYLLLQKNGAFQSEPHIHFHFLPVHSESWKQVFNGALSVKKMDPDTLNENVNRFRVYFSQ